MGDSERAGQASAREIKREMSSRRAERGALRRVRRRRVWVLAGSSKEDLAG